MQKNVNMYRLEEASGLDIREIIHTAVREHGTVTAAAAALGITRQTLQNWIGLLEGHTEARTETRTEVMFDGWSPAVTSEAVPA